jgi:hypothetical protein
MKDPTCVRESPRRRTFFHADLEAEREPLTPDIVNAKLYGVSFVKKFKEAWSLTFQINPTL